MEHRRSGGRETWHRLREWDRGQQDSERLGARLLPFEGYEHINPSHPLGGPDGGKDICCQRNDQNYIVAVYFPRGQKELSAIKQKFGDDLKKAISLGVKGFVFFTNQELTLSERAELEDSTSQLIIDIHHLERIASSLDTPRGYGLRLEFLSIPMTTEEQISFFNDRDQVLYEIRDLLLEKKKKNPGIKTVSVQQEWLTTASASPFGSRLMECKECGEIFRAEYYNRMYTASVASFGYGNLETVECPACGKIQAYK